VNWLLTFANNLSWPVIIFSLVGMVFCGATILRNISARGEAGMAAPVCFLLLAAMVSMFWAIPAPDYDMKIVYRDKIVEKKVPVVKFTATKVITKVPLYKETFLDCMDHVEDSSSSNAQCHRQALEAVRASQPQPREVVKRFIQHDPYQELFKACNDYDLDDTFKKDPVEGARLRNERLRICHNNALQASTPRQYLH